MARVIINLRADEKDALLELADREFRDPRAQAALIIRTELERRGLLPVVPTSEQFAQQQRATRTPQIAPVPENGNSSAIN